MVLFFSGPSDKKSFISQSYQSVVCLSQKDFARNIPELEVDVDVEVEELVPVELVEEPSQLAETCSRKKQESHSSDQNPGLGYLEPQVVFFFW